ncbi:MAG: Holliday junction branch migration protein RuvA, partial [Deltaproteobacteria bacterium]|nr:Holliday junction branch migration protein RuvA [Deltaproteobacteria bacterium]
MIAYLRGRVLDRTDGSVVLDVGGVGYDVWCDRQTLLAVAEAGSECALHVRTVVREDAITLYGFADAVTRDVFDMLTGVAGVGPKMASGVLGGLPLPEFVEAVRAKNVKKLTTISGVGRKTAERLVLELGEKFMALPVEAPAAPAGVPAGLVDDVRSALANLGFGPRDVEAAVRGLKPGASAMDLEGLLRP